MRAKSISVVLVAIVIILATVGVSFALWEPAPTEYEYIVNTDTYATVEIKDITLDSAKLMPKAEGSSVATIVTTNFNVLVTKSDCNLKFTFPKMQFFDKKANAWEDVPVGIIDAKIHMARGVSGGSAIVGLNGVDANVGVHSFMLKTNLIQSIELIDPKYKDTTFRMNVTISATVLALTT